MNAEEILAQVKANTQQRTENWTVFPLLRRKVITSIIGWIFGILIGVGLLLLIGPIVIPYNYQHSLASIVFTTLLLLLLVFVAIGSFCLMIGDIRRLRNIHSHIIVITNADFIKQEGLKSTQVPLENVRHVTTRGRAPIEHQPNTDDDKKLPNAGENLLATFLGRGLTPAGMQWKRKRMRTPTSLAFIDTRTNQEITVVNDTTYGDPFLIAAVLKKYSQSAS